MYSCSDLRDCGQWQQVPAWCSKYISSVTNSSSQVPLHNRYKALQMEPNNEDDYGLSRLELSPRLSWPVHCVKTTFIKKKRQVIGIGESLLRGTEGPICGPDTLVREICSLPGAQVKDVMKLSSLMWPWCGIRYFFFM